MNPALLFLIRRSLVNAIRTKILRLKNPRYLVPTVLGAAYFIFLFSMGSLRPGGNRGYGSPPPDPAGELALEWLVTGGILAMSTLSWILPVRGAPLAFLEPEVAQLFPAPVTRRELVNYKLLDYQRFYVFMPIVIALFNLGHLGIGGAARIALGIWIGLMAMALFSIGAKMTRFSMAENGWSGWKRSLVPIFVIVGGLGFLWMTAPPLPEIRDVRHAAVDLQPWFGDFDRSPAAWALLPFRAVVHPFFAHGFSDYLLAVGGAGIVLAALYLWVMRTDVAFEEASTAQAESLSRRIEAAKKGRFFSGEPGKPARKNPFPLSPSGSPEGVFVWKSVAELLRGMSVRLLMFVMMAVVIAIPISIDKAKSMDDAGDGILAGAAVVMAMLAGFLVFVGPSMIGVNLRQDLERVEVLKTFPLTGGRLVRCSLAGTLVPIAVLQAILVIGAVLLFPNPPKLDLTASWRLAAAVIGLCSLPAITAISATVEAGLVLYFPGWVKPGQPVVQGGMEGMGYGMVTAIVKVLTLAIGLAVPAGVGIGIAFLGVALRTPLWTPAFAMVGAFAGTLLVGVEIWLLSAILGRRFEAFDPADEGLVA